MKDKHLNDQVSSGQTLFWILLLLISLLQHFSSCIDYSAADVKMNAWLHVCSHCTFQSLKIIFQLHDYITRYLIIGRRTIVQLGSFLPNIDYLSDWESWLGPANPSSASLAGYSNITGPSQTRKIHETNQRENFVPPAPQWCLNWYENQSPPWLVTGCLARRSFCRVVCEFFWL